MSRGGSDPPPLMTRAFALKGGKNGWVGGMIEWDEIFARAERADDFVNLCYESQDEHCVAFREGSRVILYDPEKNEYVFELEDEEEAKTLMNLLKAFAEFADYSAFPYELIPRIRRYALG